MSEETKAFVVGIVVGVFLMIGAVSINGGKYSRPYRNGVEATHKEAFKQGLMTKEIGENDKVIYRWVETHKLGYENQ